MRILRILKGIALTAVTWAIAWVPLSLALVGIGALVGVPLPPRAYWGFLVAREAIGGAINGAVFGTVLALFGRRQTFATLSIARMALCGAIGGAVFPLFVMTIVLRFVRLESGAYVMPPSAVQLGLGLAISSAVGAVCAATSLAIARRAPELPVAEAGHIAEISAGTA